MDSAGPLPRLTRVPEFYDEMRTCEGLPVAANCPLR